MNKFSGQVVLITGGAAGIGLGVARAFHEAGASVAIGDYRTDALENARDAFGGSSRLAVFQLDVRDEESVARFVSGAESVFGPITVFVANAGIYPNAPVLDMAPSEWDAVMETNVRGVFLTCQAAARSMVRHSNKGKIITISSGAAKSGRRGASHYCASKAGVEMFTKVLAMELAGHKINVNCVAPGAIQVGSSVSPTSDEYRAALLTSIPWGRIGTPGDISNAVLFLASPDAEFMTGAVIAVDGGSSAGRAFLPESSPSV